jgi:hypothetical protein
MLTFRPRCSWLGLDGPPQQGFGLGAAVRAPSCLYSWTLPWATRSRRLLRCSRKFFSGEEHVQQPRCFGRLDGLIEQAHGVAEKGFILLLGARVESMD